MKAVTTLAFCRPLWKKEKKLISINPTRFRRNWPTLALHKRTCCIDCSDWHSTFYVHTLYLSPSPSFAMPRSSEWQMPGRRILRCWSRLSTTTPTLEYHPTLCYYHTSTLNSWLSLVTHRTSPSRHFDTDYQKSNPWTESWYYWKGGSESWISSDQSGSLSGDFWCGCCSLEELHTDPSRFLLHPPIIATITRTILISSCLEHIKLSCIYNYNCFILSQ